MKNVNYLSHLLDFKVVTFSIFLSPPFYGLERCESLSLVFPYLAKEVAYAVPVCV